MNDTIIFIDIETQEEICQYVGKGFIIPNVDEVVFIKKSSQEVKCKVSERLFSYFGDWTNNCVIVSIFVYVMEGGEK